MTARSQEHVEPAKAEHRAAPRRRVLLQGKIVYGPTNITLDCAIRNLSRSGARVRLASATPLPAEVKLVEIKDGMAFDCHVVWRAMPEFGLAFTRAYDLARDTRPELRPLRRIWIDNAAR